MKKYKIPVVYQMWGLVNIEANSLEEATQKVIEQSPLPDGNYIDDSVQIDLEGIEIHCENLSREELLKINKISPNTGKIK